MEMVVSSAGILWRWKSECMEWGWVSWSRLEKKKQKAGAVNVNSGDSYESSCGGHHMERWRAASNTHKAGDYMISDDLYDRNEAICLQTPPNKTKQGPLPLSP
jgi:hypothetical protein